MGVRTRRTCTGCCGICARTLDTGKGKETGGEAREGE